MILQFSLGNILSVLATENLLKLVNAIFETKVLPDSKYFVDNVLNSDQTASYHTVCHNCDKYLGILQM